MTNSINSLADLELTGRDHEEKDDSLNFGVFDIGDSKPVALFRNLFDAECFVLSRGKGDTYFHDIDTDGSLVWEQTDIEDKE